MNPIIYEQTANKRGRVRFVLSVMSRSMFIFFIRINEVITGRKAPNIMHIMVITMELPAPNRKKFITAKVGIETSGGWVIVEMIFANFFLDFRFSWGLSIIQTPLCNPLKKPVNSIVNLKGHYK